MKRKGLIECVDTFNHYTKTFYPAWEYNFDEKIAESKGYDLHKLCEVVGLIRDCISENMKFSKTDVKRAINGSNAITGEITYLVKKWTSDMSKIWLLNNEKKVTKYLSENESVVFGSMRVTVKSYIEILGMVDFYYV